MTKSMIPLGLAVLLAGLAFPAPAADAPSVPPGETLIGVLARQFEWLAQYPGPDGVLGRHSDALVSESNPLGTDPDDPAGKDDVIVGGNEIVVPADQPIRARLTSLDVLHSLGLKVAKLKQLMVPGNDTEVSFKAPKPGKYPIICIQYCGAEHDNMKGTLRVMPRAEFDAWLAARAAAAAP